jgi:hypothetical protein
MDLQIIKEFCKTLLTDKLKNLSPEAKELLIDGSYTCLFQKYGNIKIAEIVLQYYGEIIKISNSWVYRGKDNLTGFKSLKRLGVITIPVIDPREIKDLRNKFMDTLRGFPEYKRNPENANLDGSGNTLVYVLGGFAALGNPASFHNDLVRDLRRKCKKAVIPLFKELINSYVDKKLRTETKLEMLFDRMMYRQKSQQPSAESWHRDVIPPKLIQDNDDLFGGWLNLDEDDQYFSCIPGSHLGIRQKELKEGFATIPKEEVDVVGAYRYRFRVPPGHMIVFPQYILHEVVSQKSEKNMMRIFTGWRTTISTDYLHPGTKERIGAQAVMPLPSGQIPPMFAANHGSFFRSKQFKPIPNTSHKVSTIEWSVNTFLEELLDKRKDYIIPRFLTSLKEYNLPMYTEYTEEETALYRPQKIKLDFSE